MLDRWGVELICSVLRLEMDVLEYPDLQSVCEKLGLKEHVLILDALRNVIILYILLPY